MIPIRPVLLRPFVAYNALFKREFKLAAKHFLKHLFKHLGQPGSLAEREGEIRWNEGGIAVSGEATLHTEDLYVQISESFIADGKPIVMYRSCKSSTDYCGNQNNFVRFSNLLTQEGQDRFINHCKALQAAEQARRRAP